MHKFICHLILFLFLFSSVNLDGQRRSYYDGPYIFVDDTAYDVKWIQKGKPKSILVPLETDTIFQVEGLPVVDMSNLNFEADDQSDFEQVEKFTAISDVHGQYDLMIELLQAQSVIDTSLNWTYGEGHLVILGDIFDRGDKVTECLWFIFDLEKKAKEAGGKVHFLLGNHELMVLHGDMGYVHPKYRYSSGATRTMYQNLFGANTVMGQWLRTKNITIKINDFVFVHGGFSKEILEKESKLANLNNTFKEDIIPKYPEILNESEFLQELYFDNGPLWYRGYVDPTKFDIDQAEYILDKLQAETIVIGHTSMPQIISFYDNRIILIDSSIKFGNTGEIMVFEDDLIYRGFPNGQRILINTASRNRNKKSIFDFILEVSGDNQVLRLSTDVKHLKKNKLEKEYQDGTLTFVDGLDESYSFDVRVKVRGNMRKKLCSLPPLKIDFNKSDLKRRGFSSDDKLKFVLQCGESDYQIKYMHREKLVYDLYQALDTLGHRTKLIQLELVEPDGDKFVAQGFVLEDEDNMAKRLEAQVVERGVIRVEGVHRESYLKMVFFQYLICNTDWSIGGRHNMETLKLEHVDRLVPVPYDFDYSGIVGQEYAVPSDLFPIIDVSQRFFRGKDVTADEARSMINFYNSKRDELLSVCDNATYMEENSRNKFRKEIEQFYKLINNKKKFKTFVTE